MAGAAHAVPASFPIAPRTVRPRRNRRGREPRPDHRNHDNEHLCRAAGNAGPDGQGAGGTRNHLAIVERQIEKRAERMTVTAHVKTRQYGRSTSTDERHYHEAAAALRFGRRGEIDMLTRKLERQDTAIAAFRVRLRINRDAGLWFAPEEMAS